MGRAVHTSVVAARASRVWILSAHTSRIRITSVRAPRGVQRMRGKLEGAALSKHAAPSKQRALVPQWPGGVTAPTNPTSVTAAAARAAAPPRCRPPSRRLHRPHWRPPLTRPLLLQRRPPSRRPLDQHCRPPHGRPRHLDVGRRAGGRATLVSSTTGAAAPQDLPLTCSRSLSCLSGLLLVSRGRGSLSPGAV